LTINATFFFDLKKQVKKIFFCFEKKISILKNEMSCLSILDLPKDLLGVIFSWLWRIEAKGVPLTCKMFHGILNSKRWFKGWKMFKTVVICGPEKQITIEYDHCFTFQMILVQVQKNQPHVQSIFTIHPTSKQLELFAEDSSLIDFNFEALYGSKYTWEELRNMQRIFHFGFSEDSFPWLSLLT